MPQDALSTPKVVPPPGYQLQDLPQFLRESNQGTKTVSAPPMHVGSGVVVADVNPNNPTTIQVREPSLFDIPTKTHESTHVYQMSRNPAFVASVQGQANATSPKDLEYGGIEGLLKAQLQRKTIANFSAEQQANIVADYQRLTQTAIRKGDAAGLAKIVSAYHPFVQQLAKIPPKGANMTQMTKQDLTPAAPMPPVNAAGMPLLPDKLIGGDVKLLKQEAIRRKPM